MLFLFTYLLRYNLFIGENTRRGRVLKKTAVPSQKLPASVVTMNSRSDSKRVERLSKRKSGECSQAGTSKEWNQSDDIQEAEKPVCEKVSSSESNVPNIASSTDKIQRLVHDSEIQVSMEKMTTLSDLLNSESALRSFTGINNFQILNCLEEMTRKVLHDTRLHRLGIRERIILTMTKLKLDLSYVTLATLFSISGQLCKTYFFNMLPILSSVLKPAMYFPSSEEISKNIPKCFKQFSSCRVVLDCTEIVVQKPSCLCCRIKFYSHYKGNTTVKFMTGVSPAGMIIFISQSYGGRASDKLIFEESNVINKLCSNKDSIMVDKGFLIDDICAVNKIKLIRPPFLRKKQQLSPEEAVLNQQIAAARVHIERSNQRLKIFKIISGKLQWSLVPKIDEIFTIICGITNLSSSILSDERFI